MSESVAAHNDQNHIAKPGGIRVSTRRADPTHKAYLTRDWYEEAVSAFYPEIEKRIAPKLILDIGANHGVAALIAKKSMPSAKVICVEPIPELYPYIDYNLKSNGVDDYEVIRGICGEKSKEARSFHLNPHGSGDSRVIAPNPSWQEITVEEVTLGELLDDVGPDDGVYIKIDTQGYEPLVFRGGADALRARKKWVLKCEFGPRWIELQNENPQELLRYLVNNFDVAEFPARFSFKTNYIDWTERYRLTDGEISDFMEYVTGLFRDNLGWVDLLVMPKAP